MSNNMDNNEIVVTSPGKVILHGEHSVVYGKLALAVSINLRTRVTIRPLPTNPPDPGSSPALRLNFPDLGKTHIFMLADLADLWSANLKSNSNEDLDRNLVNAINDFVSAQDASGGKEGADAGVVAFLYLFLAQSEVSPLEAEWAKSGLEATVVSQIPIGAGLGSSAAFSVASAGAIYRLNLKTSEEEIINNNSKTTNGAHLDAKLKNGAKRARMAAAAAGKENGATKKMIRAEDEVMTSFDPASQKEVCKWAFLAEKILHGNPSGIDNSVCTFGGLLSYQHNHGMQPLRAPSNLRILLINTTVSRNTKALVERVRSRVVILPKVSARILEAMDLVSYSCLETLDSLRRLSNNNNGISAAAAATNGGSSSNGNSSNESSSNESSESEEESGEEARLFRKLEELIDTNQGLLSSLGVSHPSLEKVAAIAAASDVHAKLTGAGGGGFAFGLLTPRHTAAQIKEVRKGMEQSGFDCWETVIGGAGVQYRV